MNLANLPQEEKDKINVDLAASGVAYRERLGKEVIDIEVEQQQPEHLREYFRERLAHYREVSKRFPRGYTAKKIRCLPRLQFRRS
ncbi:DNA polymerase III subunit theta [Proteus mirabilis]|uniref:DNA polymerase III subunit theta n=1 Tax=Proteus mirabilis TaxID=584 RepID=UPI0023494B68|nr:DNA polymerase III subunit theta [Proteus mirabilis]MDC6033418.1 DNA polymerase III subunit theta [Proteus mirabilis]MDC6045362.1 DNA polymerase III subunit theta [Proteus mirabilis]MDC6054515.1 DNA polymerase III subunit theta [Proteus mirabilis]MDC6065060.1 DNA polymerase III subunit theta [Proteus mirabilis]